MTAYIVTVTVDNGPRYKTQSRHTTHHDVSEAALVVSTVVLCAGICEQDANLIAAGMRGEMLKTGCVKWSWHGSRGHSVEVQKVAA